MKTYIIDGKIDGLSFNYKIEADYFSYSRSGCYQLKNSKTGSEWLFPIYRTIIKVVGKNDL